MPSGLCYQCGPRGAKGLTAMGQIKQVKMHVDAHTRQIIYLCARCARELGYLEKKPSPTAEGGSNA